MSFPSALFRIILVTDTCRDFLKFIGSFSEVKTYDPSGDSTLPTCSKKRKIEHVDKEDEIVEKKAKKSRVKIKG